MAKSSLMVIGAHCDDIELCFGATMLKYHENFGYDIVYVQSTNNMSGGWCEVVKGPRAGLAEMPPWITEKRTIIVPQERHHTVPWYHEMQQRKKEAANSARTFFHTEPIHLDYAQRHYTDRELNNVDLRYGAPAPDCYDPEIPTIMTACDDPAQIERITKLILEKNPEVILTHSPVDYTFEHSGTTLLVNKAFHKARDAGYDGSLLCSIWPAFQQMGSFYDRWDAFVDTSGFHAKKTEAIGMHACQMPDPDKLDLFDPHAGKICGCETAELYTVVQLSETRGGALTEELSGNHAQCNENWMQMFFSPESRKVFENFRAQIGLSK